ncbi:MAG: Gfo/Idh/MocA family oxidoreductase [Rhizobiales bacterium]|nr:Gfo/Idh/MocA family oxidoreductase [Hyphomicrobiales bacterium]NRB12904.1 Gfo/Idh/MocA family oxidoreductase [Hyphomicrobiales bacterium]
MKTNVIKTAFIGTGRISDLHAIEYLQNPNAKIVALCDTDADIAKGRAAAWGLTDAIIETDVDRLLARNDIDLVEIMVPHHLHLPIALKAIAAGKAVSLQKPMCLSLQEADQLVEAAEASSNQFKVFENFIFYPPVIKAKQLIDAGAIGDPISIRIKSNPGKSKTAWKVPTNANAWRQKKSRSGGGPLVFDDGHHKFALAWFFMGEPTDVHSFIGETTTPDGTVLDAPSIISFRFENNRIGNLEVVYSPELEIITQHYAQDDRVEITGSKGVLWINCGHGRIGGPPPLAIYRDGNVTNYHDIPTGWEQSFVMSTRHYIQALQENTQPSLTAIQARKILQFALAAEQSSQDGKSISID